MEISDILVAEPQFKGAKHSSVNAALLVAAALVPASSRARTSFIAPPDHVRWVQSVLEGSQREPANVNWLTLPRARSTSTGMKNARSELAIWLRVLKASRQLVAKALLVCSVTRPGLAVLPIVGAVAKRLPIVVIVHQLNQLLEPRAGRRTRLDRLLTLPKPRNIQFVAPAMPVVEELTRRFPVLARGFGAIDLPYLWASSVPTPPPADPRDVVFGFFGGGRKGRIEPFLEVAAVLKERFPRARFMLVGHLQDWRQHPAVEGLQSEPLPPEEYRRRAAEVHFAVWTSPPEDYLLAASASFLDALSFVKPVIYLRNLVMEYYHQRMGDIGYACGSLDELRDRMAGLAESFPAQAYHAKCAAVLSSRDCFAPESAADSLRRLFAGLRR